MKQYQMYIANASHNWYHVFIIDNIIFKLEYLPRSVKVKILKTKPKGLTTVKLIMPYSTPYSTAKNIMHSYKESGNKSQFSLIYPFIR